jgi:hypothetical protein
MITIKSTTPGVLTIETPESEKEVRLNPGNTATVITGSGALIRILNDVGGPVTFSPIQLGDVTINTAATELQCEETESFLYISQFGEKVTI